MKIRLYNGEACLIDEEDYPKVKGRSWYKSTNGYPVSFGGKVTTYMHRLVMNAKNEEIIDHINGNTLDNRKNNLRIVTRRENSMNRHHKRSSKYPGVYWHSKRKRWQSYIEIDGKAYFLKSFNKNNEMGAAEIYRRAVNEHEKGTFNNFLHDLKKERKNKLTSKYVGVNWDFGSGKWRATITFQRIKFHLGLFENEEEAHAAYLKSKNAIRDGNFHTHYNSIRSKYSDTFEEKIKKHYKEGGII